MNPQRVLLLLGILVIYVLGEHWWIVTGKKLDTSSSIGDEVSMPWGATVAHRPDIGNGTLSVRERGIYVAQTKESGPISNDPKNSNVARNKRKRRSRSGCSCLNSTSVKRCCHRILLTVHKGGYVVSNAMVKGKKQLRIWNDALSDFHPFQDPFYDGTDPLTPDYRYVAVIRDAYEMMISGYLYHKAGRECGPDNIKTEVAEQRKSNFGQFVKINHINYTYPPFQNRTLCDYLAEESEEDGMRVFVDGAYHTWYSRLVHPFWSSMQERKSNLGEEKTMLLCYDQLIQPDGFDILMNWFFPGGHSFDAPESLDMMPFSASSATSNSSKYYDGSHSTSKEPVQRARLLALAKTYDAELLNGALESINTHFHCGANRSRSTST